MKCEVFASVCSDGSNATVQPGASNARPRMDIACVLDVTQSTNIAHRKRALEEVRLAADLVNGNLHHIHVSFFSYTGHRLTTMTDKKVKLMLKKLSTLVQ